MASYHMCIKDSDSFLRGLSRSDFHLLFARDEVFRDYFNKYCFLPIFGQKLAYLTQRSKFVYDPPPASAMRKQHIAPDIVCEWLFQNRFPSFAESKAVDEYKLCTLLSYHPLAEKLSRDLPYGFSGKEEGDNWCSDLGENFRRFQLSHFGGVSKMLEFRNFVAHSKHGQHLISFWMDVEHLKRISFDSNPKSIPSRNKQDEVKRHHVRLLLSVIQTKYYRRTCKFSLPLHFLGVELGRSDRAYGLDFTMNLQNQILRRLQDYWAPRFLIYRNKRNRTRKGSSMLEQEIAFLDEEQLLEDAIRRSTMVRYVPIPTEESSSSGEPQTVPEEESILLRDEEFGKLFADEATSNVCEDQGELNGSREDVCSQGPASAQRFEVDSASSRGTMCLSNTPRTSEAFSVDLKEGDAKIRDDLIQGDSPYDSLPVTTPTSSVGYEADNSSNEDFGTSSPSRRKRRVCKDARHGSVVLTPKEDDTRKSTPLYPEVDISAAQRQRKKIASKTMMSYLRKACDANDTGPSSGVRNSLEDKIPRYKKVQNGVRLRSPDVQIQDLFPARPEEFEDQSARQQNRTERDKLSSEGPSRILPSIKITGPDNGTVKHRTNKNKGSSGKVHLPRIRKSTTKTKGSRSSTTSSSTSYSSSSISTASLKLGKAKKSSASSSSRTSDFRSIASSDSEKKWIGRDLIDSDYQSDDEGDDVILKRNDWQKAFAEILLADELSGFVFRGFLSSRNDAGTALGEKGEGKTEQPQALVMALDFWRDVEDFRRVYFSQEAHELERKYGTILRTYIFTDVLDSGISSNDKVKDLLLCMRNLTVDTSQPFPQELIALQNELQLVLEEQWIQFSTEDRGHFQTNVLPMFWRVGTRRNSFPTSLEEVRTIPIFRMYRDKVNIVAEQPTQQLDKGEEGKMIRTLRNILGYNNKGQFKYRASRAVYLFLMLTRSAPGAFDHTYGHCWNDYDDGVGAEVDSDDDGCMPPMPLKKHVRVPEIDGKRLAELSAIEYPKKGVNYASCRGIRIVQRRRLGRKPLYLRPIRKGGVVYYRPQKKPKNLAEVLQDPVHAMFFGRYLRLHNAEVPYLFLKAVDRLKTIGSAAARQKKVKSIIRKFFGKQAGRGVLLQCNDARVKELGHQMVNVTAAMLIDAQTLVYESMERNWQQRYLQTFADPVGSKEEEKGHNTDFAKSRPWKVFSDFIRRAANFIRTMRNVKKYNEFREYLSKLPTHERWKAAGDASSTTLMMRTAIYKEHGADLVAPLTICTVLGRRVVLEYMPNDLAFWLEVDRFNAFIDNAKAMIFSGSHEERDYLVIEEKANTILECFIDSTVYPKLRINMDREAAQNILTNYNAKEIDRPMFHEGIIETFPLLLTFWTEFRSEKFVYVSKKVIRALRHKAAKARREKQEQALRAKRERNFLTVPGPTISAASMRKRALPDYVHDLMRKRSPYERVKGLIVKDPPILQFSIQHGLKLILPPSPRAKEGEIARANAYFNAWVSQGSEDSSDEESDYGLPVK